MLGDWPTSLLCNLLAWGMFYLLLTLGIKSNP